MSISELRSLWITDVCNHVLDWLPKRYVDLLDQCTHDLGPHDLVGALIVAQAARFESEAVPADRIVAAIVKSGVFDGTDDPEARSRTLLSAVRQSLSRAPLPGAEPWDPAGTEMMLLEFWAAARLQEVRREQVEQEARDVWGVEDPRVVKYLSDLPADPLGPYETFFDMAHKRDDPAVSGLLMYAMARDGVQNFASRWRAGTPHPDPWHPLEHINDLKDDMALATAVPRFLGQHVDDPDLDEPTRLSVRRAIHEGHRHRELLANQLDGLSTFEVRLLEPLEPTDVAVAAALAQLLANSSPFDEFSSAGVYGGTPWWSARVTPETSNAAIAVMSSGETQFFYSHDTARGLVMIGVQADHGSQDIIAGQQYELKNFEDVGLLLLLDRAGAVGVDLVDDNGPTLEIVHTGHFTIPQWLRDSIREAAEPALLNLLSDIAEDKRGNYARTLLAAQTTLGSTEGVRRRPTSANYLEVNDLAGLAGSQRSMLPAFDEDGAPITPSPEHVLDYLVSVYDLADNVDDVLERPSPGIVAVVQLPTCDRCGAVARYDSMVTFSNGVRGGTNLCPRCLFLQADHMLGSGHSGYLMHPDEVPDSVRSICDELSRRSDRPSIFASDVPEPWIAVYRKFGFVGPDAAGRLTTDICDIALSVQAHPGGGLRLTAQKKPVLGFQQFIDDVVIPRGFDFIGAAHYVRYLLLGQIGDRRNESLLPRCLTLTTQEAVTRTITALRNGTYSRYCTEDPEAVGVLGAGGWGYILSSDESLDRRAAKMAAEQSDDESVLAELAATHPDEEVRTLALTNRALPVSVLREVALASRFHEAPVLRRCGRTEKCP